MNLPLILASTALIGALGACSSADTPADMSGGQYSQAPTRPPAADYLPPCENEDGPGPCRWNAQTMGNGVGLSYTITCDQVTIYDDPEWDEMRGGKYEGYPSTCDDPLPAQGRSDTR